MATIRRLSDSDVRTIFECLHQNRRPPGHLKFKIVPIGPNGLKLSPPCFAFEDGLYVLLRPQKKKKNALPEEQPRAPSHLLDCVMRESPPETCQWSLSGPQFPQPTAIQQRYCYPKGDPHYSSQKGGALWTMYGTDGKEDTEYRLLHVYFSAKRAVNKGLSIPQGWQGHKSPPPAKTPSPYKRYSKRARAPAASKQQQAPAASPPTSTAASSFCPSPLSFADHGSSAASVSYLGSPDTHGGTDSNFIITPNSSTAANMGGAFDEGRFFPLDSPIRPRFLLSASTRNSLLESSRLPSHPSPLMPDAQNDDHDTLAQLPLNDRTVVGGCSFEALDDACLNLDQDVEDDWSHPAGGGSIDTSRNNHDAVAIPWNANTNWTRPRGFSPPPQQQQQHRQDNHTHHHRQQQRLQNHPFEVDPDERLRLFQDRLADVHDSLRSNILSAHETDQAPLVSILCHWAIKVAQAPLEPHPQSKRDDDDTQHRGNLHSSAPTTASV